MGNIDQQVTEAYLEYFNAMEEVIKIKKTLSIAKAAAEAKYNAWQQLLHKSASMSNDAPTKE